MPDLRRYLPSLLPPYLMQITVSLVSRALLCLLRRFMKLRFMSRLYSVCVFNLICSAATALHHLVLCHEIDSEARCLLQALYCFSWLMGALRRRRESYHHCRKDRISVYSKSNNETLETVSPEPLDGNAKKRSCLLETS